MLIKQLHYLVALDRERHFGRAAAACKVSQPSLSAAIRQLELDFGVPIVERGQRFQGLTQEGRIVLDWARRILSDCESMKQNLDAIRGGLSGRLRIGVVPSAQAIVPRIIRPFTAEHPQVTVGVLTHSSQEIQSDLDNFQLDLGLTYLDNEALTGVRSIPLYVETYHLLTPADGPFGERETVSWTEAATLSMCLLTPNMQNRRIIDDVFRRLDCAPAIEVEANAYSPLCGFVQAGRGATVLPKQFLDLFGPPAGTRAYRLTDPGVHHVMGWVVPRRDPTPPLVAAMLAVASKAVDPA